MAISTAILGREKKISTLAKRLFEIEGPNRIDDLKRAERALLKANPHLAQTEGFKHGMVIIVPGNLGLKKTDRVKTPKADLDGSLDHAATQLELATRMLDDAFENSVKETEQTLSRLSNAGFKAKLKKELPESGNILAKTKKAMTKHAQEHEKNKAKFSEAIEMAEAEIKRLKSLFNA